MHKLKNLIYFAPAVLWMVGVIILSTKPLNNIEIPSFSGLDKIVHFLFYAILVLLFSWGFFKCNRFNLSKLLFSAYWSILLGGLIELIQHYLIENRTGDWWDFLANIIGVVFMSYILYRKLLARNN